MHPMVTVQRWAGVETKALRQAMRLSIRAFAAYLGVDARTVNKWEARGASITLLPDTQALMDTALSRTADDVKTRFTQTTPGDISTPMWWVTSNGRLIVALRTMAPTAQRRRSRLCWVSWPLLSAMPVKRKLMFDAICWLSALKPLNSSAGFTVTPASRVWRVTGETGPRNGLKKLTTGPCRATSCSRRVRLPGMSAMACVC